MAFENMTVSFIGGGVMGEAMMKGLISQRLVEPQQIIVADPREDRGAELSERYGIRYTRDNEEAADAANILVLSIKPQVFDLVLPTVRRGAHSASLVLSILAGVRIERIANGLANASVVRAMPNTPALVGAGVTAVCAGLAVSDDQLEAAERLLWAVGSVERVPEAQMDAVTAVSGSGPAYVFLMVEALVDAGVRVGLPRDLATRLVLGTLAGSAALLAETREHPGVLRERVTSPGGTTAAALHELERHGLRAAFLDAVLANRDRARELGG